MLGAATEAEIAVAPMPASTADRTASFEGNSSGTRRLFGAIPKPISACSKAERVPEPCSRKTQSVSASSAGVTRSHPAQGCSGPTTTIIWSRATGRLTSTGSVTSPRSEEHTSEPSHLVISYAVFCLKKKTRTEELEAVQLVIPQGTDRFSSLLVGYHLHQTLDSPAFQSEQDTFVSHWPKPH